MLCGKKILIRILCKAPYVIFPLGKAPYVMLCDILYFLTIIGYYSVLIFMIDFKFNPICTGEDKFAPLSVILI